MTLPRRSLIKGVAGTAAGMLIQPAYTFATQLSGVDPLDVPIPLSYDSLKALAADKTTFFFSGVETLDSGKARLVRLSTSSSTESLVQYRLTFRPGRGVDLPSGRYRLTNWDGLPEWEIYVERGTDRRGRLRFYADFAQLL